MYVGKPNANSRSLVCKEGGFLYDSDSYSDELPYWTHEYGKPHLIIPYTLSENDMRFATPNGFSTGEEFFVYLRDHLDYLIREAKDEETNGGSGGRMMSVGLHCRLVGRAGRAAGLEKFLDYALSRGDDVWICRRDEIAKHWYEQHWDPAWGPAPTVPLYNKDGSDGGV
jgi:allantoinase